MDLGIYKEFFSWILTSLRKCSEGEGGVEARRGRGRLVGKKTDEQKGKRKEEGVERIEERGGLMGIVKRIERESEE